MERPYPDHLETLLQERLHTLASWPGLQAEIRRAERLFRGGGEGEGAGRAPWSELRFAEWFLLERESEVLGRVPGPTENEEPDPDWWLASRAGVFAVEAVGAALSLRDLQSGSLESVQPGPAPELLVGDVVLPRLYPSDTEPVLSPFAVILRPGQVLAEALIADFARLGLDRRLSQAELESVVLGRGGVVAVRDGVGQPVGGVPAPLERVEARLEQLLTRGDYRQRSVEDITASFAAADNLGAVAGPLLDEIAFHSGVDLEACRQVLNELWQALQKPDEGAPPAGEPPATGLAPTLGADLLRHLDQGLQGNRDLEQVFAEMASMAGIDPADLDEPEDEDPGIAGDLAPLVDEFLWETDADSETRLALRALVQLGENQPVVAHSLDDVTSELLLRLFVQIWLQAPQGRRVAAVRALVARVQRFLDWCADEQQLDQRATLRACGPAFVDHLVRLARAAEALGGDSEPPSPGLWRVVDVFEDGVGLRRDEGGDPVLLECGRNTAGDLRAGDLVLGDLRQEHPTAFSGYVVILPEAAEGLLG